MSNKELVISLPEDQTQSIALFLEGGASDLVSAVKKEFEGLVFDVSTTTGRKQCASAARKVASSRIAIDNHRKELVRDLKDLPKRIDTEGKKVREELEAFQEELRKPLTEYEEVEKQRAARVEAIFESLSEMTKLTFNDDPNLIGVMLEELSETDLSEATEKEAERIAEKMGRVGDHLTTCKQMAEERERQEQVRLEQQQLAEEQARKDREARIAAEAAERATKEAERRAESEKQAAIEKEQRLQSEKEAAEKAAIQAKQEAERREKEAAERAKLQAEKDAADKLAKEAAEKAAREADIENRKTKNNEAKAALIEAGLSDKQATAAIKAIASNMIPNITINY